MITLVSKIILLAALANPAPVAPKPTIFTVPILTYHHIATRKGAYYLAPVRFEQELAYLLANDYHTISMDAYADYLESEGSLPGKPVVLSFDDGYSDAYTMVYPVLKARHMTATFFIITGQVGKPGYLTWNEIKEMAANGMEIGAHTITHPYLTKLSFAAALHEIAGSRAALQSHLGTTVTTFAYPYNDHNVVTDLLVRMAGFRTACIVDFHTGDDVSDFFSIPRYTISSGESLSVFKLVVNKRGFPSIPVRR